MRIHVVGIGGTGMSAIARLFLARGDAVSGSDDGSWPLAEALGRSGAVVSPRFDPANLRGADVVVRSSAYGETNPEVRAALEAGLPVWKRHDAWRELARGKRVIAIAGTHGKTTTTAMAWTALRAGGVDASLICGAVVRGLESNAYAGLDPTLVIEADEYDRTFLALEPEIAVVTNVDHDHVDVFPTRAEYAEAFDAFAARVTGTLVACADDPGAAALARSVAARGRTGVQTYGGTADASYALSPGVSPGEFAIAERGAGPAARSSARLRVPGWHNVLDAAGAIVAAVAAGVPQATAAAALERFEGTARRLEVLGEAGGVTVIDDYAHHPAEIAAGIAACARRPIVLFQPHTPSRLHAFFAQFVDALRAADRVVVVETFSSARESPEPSSSARELAAAVGGTYAATAEEAARAVAALARPDDVVLVMGAGDVRPIGERLLGLLAERSAA